MPSLVRLIKQTVNMTRPLERRVVMHNAAALSLLQVITYLLPLLIIPYLFRVLGPDKFGLIAFAQAFIQYFIIMTNYGFNISATKEISLCRDDPLKVARVFSDVMIVKIMLTLLSLLILGAMVYFIPRFRMDWLVYIFSFGAVVGTTLFPTWFFQGIERMKYITVLNIVVGVLSAVFTLTLVRRPEDYLLVPFITSTALVVIGIWGQIIVFNHFKISFTWEGIPALRRQLDEGWNIFFSIAAINAYTTGRVFMLGLLTNNYITGFYSIAEKIANACQTFPLDSFAQAIFPRLSKIFQRNRMKALRLMQQIQQITVLISLVGLPVVFLIADIIIQLACGKAYPEAVLSLRLLLVPVFFVSANAFRVQFLLVCGKTRIYTRIHVTMALIGLPLLFLAIARYSYVGAAVATMAIEAGVFLITFLTVRRLKFS